MRSLFSQELHSALGCEAIHEMLREMQQKQRQKLLLVVTKCGKNKNELQIIYRSSRCLG